jgi:RNA polymerase sigma factor (sigma-70 family)
MEGQLLYHFYAFRRALSADQTALKTAVTGLTRLLLPTIRRRVVAALSVRQLSEGDYLEARLDLLGAVRLAVIQSLYRFDESRAPLSAYLLAVINGAIRAELADGDVLDSPDPHLEDLPDNLPQLAVDWQEATDLRIVIESAIERLPAEWGYVLRSRYYEGRTQAEVAAALNVSQSGVCRVERAALRTLQEIIGTDPRGGDDA